MTMRRSRIPVRLALAICAFVAVAWATPAVGSSAPVERGPATIGYPVRAVLTTHGAWNSICGPFGYVISSFGGPSVTTSPAVARVDVTFTLTLDLRTTAGDFGAFYASIESDQMNRHMSPGTFFFMSPSPKIMTTTTFVWAMTNLPARGLTYSFGFTATAKDGTHDKTADIIGLHMTMVAEVSEA
jgi:hypothetical protein